MSEQTHKSMLMLINALLIENIVTLICIIIPIVIGFTYEKFDPSLTAAGIKRICLTMPSISNPISDMIKLTCVKSYR
uniref:Uncharacterized protein n=1 Tax=Acrobeloides nanus TaxID=290746 RepID=A0A914DQG2_9BILA